ncbi:MAG TPA: methyltransferase [Vicinamibacterales bacterium]|nr:methyltransferase [Vicinamibacterales bacterium]
MQVFSFHVFVCEQQKPEGVPCCSARSAADVIDELRAQVARQGLAGTVQVTPCGSFGLCERGPNLVVYPEGTWYSGVQRADVAEIVASHFREGRVVQRLVSGDADAVRAEIAHNRARMLEAMQAKDTSGALPDPLQQAIRAFQESRVVLTAIELDVFTAVGGGATAPDVAARINADARATEMFLNALVAIRLLDKRGDLFSNTPVSGRYLAAGGRDDSRAALMHSVNLWRTWSRLTDSVRAGGAVAGGDVPARGPDWTEAFIAAMHKNANERAAAVVRAAGVESARTLLDVGGGSGAYAIAFARANPQLRVEVLDQPAVTPIAGRHIAAAGLQDRIRTRNGDLRQASLGRDYDIVLVSAICHMLSPDENRDLLRRCFDATAPGGRVIVQDFILEPSKTAPRSAALFALNMLVATQSGSTYSEAEYADWLRGAGFADVEQVRLPGPTGLMIGLKNAG